MSLISAAYDDVIEDFYWPRILPGNVALLRTTKSRAIMAADYWGRQGLMGARSVLLNMAGRVEIILSEHPMTSEVEAPSRETRRLSAASCFALAGNREDAYPLVLALGELGRDIAFQEMWARTRHTAEQTAPLLLQLADSLVEEPPSTCASLAAHLFGQVAPRFALWPLYRALLRIGEKKDAVRAIRLLVIAEPQNASFHACAALHDPDEEHFMYIGNAFPTDAYAQAFAGYNLVKLGRVQVGRAFADVGWTLTTPAREELSPAQYAFTAMTYAGALRSVGELPAAIEVLEVAVTRSNDPDLQAYLAMLLVTNDQSEKAILRLEAASQLPTKSAWGEVLLSTLQLERGNREMALRALDRARELRPTSDVLSNALRKLEAALSSSKAQDSTDFFDVVAKRTQWQRQIGSRQLSVNLMAELGSRRMRQSTPGGSITETV